MPRTLVIGKGPERKQRLAELMLNNATKPEPIYGWGQGLAKLLAAGTAGYLARKGNEDEEKAYKDIGDASSRAAGQWVNPDTGEGQGPTRKKNLATLLKQSGNPDVMPYAEQLGNEADTAQEEFEREKKLLEMKSNVVPKEIQIYRMLQGLDGGGAVPTAPAPTTPPPATNTAPPPPIDNGVMDMPPSKEDILALNQPRPIDGSLPAVDVTQSGAKILTAGGGNNLVPRPEQGPPQFPELQSLPMPDGQGGGFDQKGGTSSTNPLGIPTDRDLTGSEWYYYTNVMGLTPAQIAEARQSAVTTENSSGVPSVGEELESLSFENPMKRAQEAIDLLEKSASASGLVGQATANLAGFPSAELNEIINTLQSKETLSSLETLRVNAKNGASGLGQVTEREIKLLMNAMTPLGDKLSRETRLKYLAEVRDRYARLDKLVKLDRQLNSSGMNLKQWEAQTGQNLESYLSSGQAQQKSFEEMSDEELEAIINGR